LIQTNPSDRFLYRTILDELGLKGICGSQAFSALATVDSSGRRDWLSIAVSVSTLIATDAPVNARTRSSSGFNILASS
jgi:hypothetical protein